ncbi:MAG: helix-turn-helix domain-containing protein [Methanobrevibacter sp.]|nr:helix-turn-helix domain-containing protein [Candidatus Methanovirga basalitermitum]
MVRLKTNKFLFNHFGACRFAWNQMKAMSEFQHKNPCYGNNYNFNPFNKEVS